MWRLLSKIFGKRGGRADKVEQYTGNRRKLEEKLGYTFREEFYLTKSLTHRSFLRVADSHALRSFERLEFLGDSVLGLIVAEELFQKYPGMSEGDLTKNKSLLVNKKVLAHAAERIGLGQFIQMSADEERAGGRHRQSIIADCLEAVIGAVYLDGGISVTKDVVKKTISFDFDRTLEALSLRNYKGELLERLQSQGIGMPRYTVTAEDGPDHRKIFTVDVFVGGKKTGTGRGNSKKTAEQKAAEDALAALDEANEY